MISIDLGMWAISRLPGAKPHIFSYIVQQGT